jgi:putative photosynthetic complex assembly protein
LGATVLIFGALAIAAGARVSDVGTTRLTYATPLESRDLRFEDRTDGSVAVIDAKSGEVVDLMVPGTNGFVRIVMRGLARERRNAGFDSTLPFTLTRWDDGRLTIADPTTGRRNELVGFGSTNVQVFAKLLLAGRETP